MLGACSMICKQTITGAYVAWHANKLLLDVFSMICKQTNTGGMQHAT